MNQPAPSVILPYYTPRKDRLPLTVYGVEGLTAAGTNLLVTAIYFYTVSRFHWGLKQNFLLATAQGVFYIMGAMSADRLTRRFDRSAVMAWVYAIMTALPLAAMALGRQPLGVAAILLVYNGVSSVGWPIIESLAASDVDSHGLARRMSIYNQVWSAVGVIMLAIDGTLIKRWPAGIFLVPAAAHAISAVAMFLHRRKQLIPAISQPTLPQLQELEPMPRDQASMPSNALEHPSPDPEPELIRLRVLALWLSRVALPATYVVIFSIMALMPSLPVMQRLDPARQTLLGSSWMATRFLTFLVLGLGTWWHTRPRALVIAAIIMLVAFFGVTLRPSDLFAHSSPAIDLASMLLAQLILGAALGMIYSSSLYFGMVLSEGSTEHGGYHEALIGLGFILGPGTGAIAEILKPGSLYTSIAAVGTVVLLSVIAVGVTSVLARRRVQSRARYQEGIVR